MTISGYTIRPVPVKIKKLHPDARIPTPGSAEAAGYDLYASESVLVGDVPVKVPTGLAFEIPFGYCGVVYSRSSTFMKRLICTPLLVDSDYRGEVFVLVLNRRGTSYFIEKGDRIAQIRIEKLENVRFEEVDELSETVRGTVGFGSTGK